MVKHGRISFHPPTADHMGSTGKTGAGWMHWKSWRLPTVSWILIHHVFIWPATPWAGMVPGILAELFLINLQPSDQVPDGWASGLIVWGTMKRKNRRWRRCCAGQQRQAIPWLFRRTISSMVFISFMVQMITMCVPINQDAWLRTSKSFIKILSIMKNRDRDTGGIYPMNLEQIA